MTMDPPPPYKDQASISRSRGDVQQLADSMLRSAISRSATSAASPASTLSPTPPSLITVRTQAPPHPPVLQSPSQEFEKAPASLDLNRTPTSSQRRPSVISASSDQGKSPISPTPSITINGPLASQQYLPFMGSSRKLSVTEENAALREQALKDQAIIEKLKREAHRSSYVSNKQAKQRVAQLKQETSLLQAPQAIPQQLNQNIFKSACSTDLLFLIDATNSMRRSIDTVKANVKQIMTDISKAFYNEAEIRIAVVAYRDHGSPVNVEALDFTTAEKAIVFLNGLKTFYGHDIPEDVLGGLHKALNLQWKHATRCLIHICDAPPHGEIFKEYDDWDRYAVPGSEPHGLTYEPLLQLMCRMNINYALLPITNAIDKMALKFAEIYQPMADIKFSPKNRYYNTISEFKRESRNTDGDLMFLVAEIGTIYTHLRNLVVKQVLSSASRTATRTMTTLANSRSLASVDEKLDFDTSSPQPNPAWYDKKMSLEGFSPDVIAHGPQTLNLMMQSDKNIKMSTTDLTVHSRGAPFAQGAMRVAYHARTAFSTNPFVIKAFKQEGKQLAHLAEEMSCQTLCKAFALEFNSLVPGHSLDFIVTACLKDSNQRLSLEPYIEGIYTKFNNNCGYVNDNHALSAGAQAFSHFSFERSRGQFLVCDLQGVGNTFTDPAIHARDDQRFRLLDTNLGSDGFKFFFATHECNSICKALLLKSTANMLLFNSFEFRETWPGANTTVCCSNRFCGKILTLDSAKKVLVHPGFLWCDGCYPQIEASTRRLACVGPGPHHTFSISLFFFESQGRKPPLTCPTHRTRDETIRPPTVPGDGGGLLKRLGFGKK